MTAELLSELVKNPKKLANFNLHELRSLALQYPYCNLFHQFVALRQKMESGEADKQVLARAATFAPDRTRLMVRLGKISQAYPAIEENELFFDSEQPTADENVAEIEETTTEVDILTNGNGQEQKSKIEDEVNERETILETSEIIEEAQPKDEKNIPETDKEAVLEPSEISEETQPMDEIKQPESPKEPSLKDTDDITELPADVTSDENIEEPKEEPTSEIDLPETLQESEEAPLPPMATETTELPKQPQPEAFQTETRADAKDCYVKEETKYSTPETEDRDNKTEPLSFSAWLKQTKPPTLLKMVPPEEKSGNTKIKKQKKGIEGIPGSYEPEPIRSETVGKHRDIISETLAQILVIQGRYEEALEMYKLLQLKMPKKSAYFALQIRELEKKSSSV